jgi:outer membrane protein TolC
MEGSTSEDETVRHLIGLTLSIGLTVHGIASVPPREMNQTRALTLETAVAIALDKNPNIRAARQGVTAAKEAGGEARAPYYPDLKLTARYPCAS